MSADETTTLAHLCSMRGSWRWVRMTADTHWSQRIHQTREFYACSAVGGLGAASGHAALETRVETWPALYRGREPTERRNGRAHASGGTTQVAEVVRGYEWVGVRNLREISRLCSEKKLAVSGKHATKPRPMAKGQVEGGKALIAASAADGSAEAAADCGARGAGRAFWRSGEAVGAGQGARAQVAAVFAGAWRGVQVRRACRSDRRAGRALHWTSHPGARSPKQ
eukprot:scaffold2492_cov33-Phaeocystis_antarctica.AAC.1